MFKLDFMHIMKGVYSNDSFSSIQNNEKQGSAPQSLISSTQINPSYLRRTNKALPEYFNFAK